MSRFYDARYKPGEKDHIKPHYFPPHFIPWFFLRENGSTRSAYDAQFKNLSFRQELNKCQSQRKAAFYCKESYGKGNAFCTFADSEFVLCMGKQLLPEEYGIYQTSLDQVKELAAQRKERESETRVLEFDTDEIELEKEKRREAANHLRNLIEKVEETGVMSSLDFDSRLTPRSDLIISQCDYDDLLVEDSLSDGHSMENPFLLQKKLACFAPKLFPMQYLKLSDCLLKNRGITLSPDQTNVPIKFKERRQNAKKKEAVALMNTAAEQLVQEEATPAEIEACAAEAAELMARWGSFCQARNANQFLGYMKHVNPTPKSLERQRKEQAEAGKEWEEWQSSETRQAIQGGKHSVPQKQKKRKEKKN
eukprot:TRINITY_DN1999_c0_g1_i2.p1 TRINITY_DN1999_c0_g1~~TRINITY_DN1999_c0_g1_i2.p1  ORF type:complete len:364 (+),score=75.86 TRINITY_DN1999_c0_g1_i2:113-1204(+)